MRYHLFHFKPAPNQNYISLQRNVSARGSWVVEVETRGVTRSNTNTSTTTNISIHNDINANTNNDLNAFTNTISDNHTRTSFHRSE